MDSIKTNSEVNSKFERYSRESSSSSLEPINSASSTLKNQSSLNGRGSNSKLFPDTNSRSSYIINGDWRGKCSRCGESRCRSRSCSRQRQHKRIGLSEDKNFPWKERNSERSGYERNNSKQRKSPTSYHKRNRSRSRSKSRKADRNSYSYDHKNSKSRPTDHIKSSRKLHSNSRRSSSNLRTARSNSLSDSRMSRSITGNSGSQSSLLNIPIVFNISLESKDICEGNIEQKNRRSLLVSLKEETKAAHRMESSDLISNMEGGKLKELNLAFSFDNNIELNPTLRTNNDKKLKEAISSLSINKEKNIGELDCLGRDSLNSPVKTSLLNKRNVSSKFQISLDDFMPKLSQSPSKVSNESLPVQKVSAINKQIVYIKELLCMMGAVKDDLGIFYYIYNSLRDKFGEAHLDQDLSSLHTNNVLVGLRLIQDHLRVNPSSEDDKERIKLNIILKIDDILHLMKISRQEFSCPRFLYGLDLEDLANCIRDMLADDAKKFIDLLLHDDLPNPTLSQVEEVYQMVLKLLVEKNLNNEM